MSSPPLGLRPWGPGNLLCMSEPTSRELTSHPLSPCSVHLASMSIYTVALPQSHVHAVYFATLVLKSVGFNAGRAGFKSQIVCSLSMWPCKNYPNPLSLSSPTTGWSWEVNKAIPNKGWINHGFEKINNWNQLMMIFNRSPLKSNQPQLTLTCGVSTSS